MIFCFCFIFDWNFNFLNIHAYNIYIVYDLSA